MRILAYLLLSATMVLTARAEGFSIQGDIGLAPTTMGTVGERVELNVRLPPTLRLQFSGYNDRYLSAAQEMDLYGGPVFGDASRDVRIGQLNLHAGFSLGSLKLTPFISGSYESAEGYTIVRLLQPGSNLPEETSRFMDIKIDESIIDFSGGCSIDLARRGVYLSVSGEFSPVALWVIDTSRFLSGVTWPGEPVPEPGIIVNPSLYWAIRKEALELNTTRYGASVSAWFELVRLGLSLSAFGQFSRLAFSGMSDIRIKGYTPYKTGDGATELDELPLDFLESSQTNSALVNITHDEIEAGLNIRLVFLESLLNLRGAPGLIVSYGKQSREYLYDYLDSDPTLSAEMWIEQYSFMPGCGSDPGQQGHNTTRGYHHQPNPGSYSFRTGHCFGYGQRCRGNIPGGILCG